MKEPYVFPCTPCGHDHAGECPPKKVEISVHGDAPPPKPAEMRTVQRYLANKYGIPLDAAKDLVQPDPNLRPTIARALKESNVGVPRRNDGWEAFHALPPAAPPVNLGPGAAYFPDGAVVKDGKVAFWAPSVKAVPEAHRNLTIIDPVTREETTWSAERSIDLRDGDAMAFPSGKTQQRHEALWGGGHSDTLRGP